MTNKLLIIDALNLIRRIFAIEESFAKDKPEHAIQNCSQNIINACRRILKTDSFSHAIAVFDGSKSWRYHYYSDYKANRKPMPDKLKQNLPALYKSFQQCGISVLTPEYDEADDVIATLAYRAHTMQIPATIVSTDKGFLPFTELNTISVLDHFEKRYRDKEYVLEKFGVSPNKLFDYWALTGDKTNDIPGVKGIGKKTACDIVNNYQSVHDAICVEQSNTKWSQKLVSNYRDYIVSKLLVTLRTDVSINLNLRDIRKVEH